MTRYTPPEQSRLLQFVDIAFLLIAIGLQAILIEISSPGGWVAGFVGVVCLTLAVYGMGVLPVNWFGLVFLLTAFVLFILDIKAPTHGALTAAGVGSFIIGALVLFNSPGTPQFQRVSIPLVIIVSLLLGAMFAVILAIALRAQHAPKVIQFLFQPRCTLGRDEFRAARLRWTVSRHVSRFAKRCSGDA